MKVAVVSSFPRGTSVHGTDTVGGASYTKNLLLAATQKGISYTVYGDILENEPHQSTLHESITVNRTWKRSSLTSLFSLWASLKSSPERLVLISFEAYMFGSLFSAGIFLIYMTLLRLLSTKKLIFILHQVPGDEFFAGSTMYRVLVKVGLSIFYGWIKLINTHCVVFEEYLKQQLGGSHVSVIPHAVEQIKSISQSIARKELGLPSHTFVVLYFGYIAAYKGLDKLIHAWPKNDKIQLIVAGGPNRHHESESAYREMVRRLTHDAHQQGVMLTGFVPEEQIKYYFSACDAVILPYQYFMSSSGPLSLAFSYEKPILLSQPLDKYFLSSDMRVAADSAQLEVEDICIDITSNAIQKGIEKIKQNKGAYVSFSKNMKNQRAWKLIANKYIKLLHTYE